MIERILRNDHPPCFPYSRQELIPRNDFAAILQKQQQASGGWRIEADALPVPGKRPQLIHIGIKYNLLINYTPIK
ncbi:hypothetical protein NUBL13453_21360 [Klebsiella pneumoniae]|nr:hypothetical protein OCUBac04_46370 [Klebsiella pneumoniae]GJI74487.1 hypothetical protein KP2269_31220 [Klebsiella pneumoniae]GJI79432.1 hypothetical protein KP2270_29020 [Klebsiella pneumoniae]GJI84493.1 hypothetical protein KP2271_28140 [Klebsiella pneumoniae]GKK23949.1 hypothetical protein NUBL21986_36580 [Klebsiella pneumoniae]